MKEGITVIVCGGRNFSDTALVYDTLDRIHAKNTIGRIIQGGAQGADERGKWWADANCIEHKTYKADWKKHGKSAGPIRNQEMLELAKPDLVVAFPGGRGTADMINRALRAGIETIDVLANQHTG